MYISGKVYPLFNYPAILPVSESPEPVVQNSIIHIHVSDSSGKRYSVPAADLVSKKEAAKKLVEQGIYAAGRFYDDSGMTKKDVLTLVHHAVFGEWDYGKKK